MHPDKHTLILTSPSLALSFPLSWPFLGRILILLFSLSYFFLDSFLTYRKNSISVHQQYERPRRINQSHSEVTRVGGLWCFDFTNRGKSNKCRSSQISQSIAVPVKYPSETSLRALKLSAPATVTYPCPCPCPSPGPFSLPLSLLDVGITHFTDRSYRCALLFLQSLWTLLRALVGVLALTQSVHYWYVTHLTITQTIMTRSLHTISWYTHVLLIIHSLMSTLST